MSDRHPSLLELSPRHPAAVLDENRAYYERIYAQAKARLGVDGQEELHDKFEKALAAGEPGLLSQAVPNYISEESLVRTFATSFGIVAPEGSADQVPEYTLPEPDAITILTVAVTAGRGGPRRRLRYKVAETQTTGSWKEISTEPVEIPFVNPFFPRKRAILEAQAADKLAYYTAKEIDNIVWTLISGSSVLKTTFASGDKVWTFKDADVTGRPTGNSKTSAASFWKTLRTTVIPYFQGAGKADRVINAYILHTDLQYLYQVAPLGATLGEFSRFQEQVFEGNIQDIRIYGHRFRIIPVNWKIATGEAFFNVGPVFKMWLPPQGNVQQVTRRDDGSEVRVASRIYEILSPSPWWTNILKSTWSTTDTNG